MRHLILVTDAPLPQPVAKLRLPLRHFLRPLNLPFFCLFVVCALTCLDHLPIVRLKVVKFSPHVAPQVIMCNTLFFHDQIFICFCCKLNLVQTTRCWVRALPFGAPPLFTSSHYDVSTARGMRTV